MTSVAKPRRRRPMPGCNHKRRDILRKRGCAAEHRMRANALMLMHSGHAAQNGPVVHLHMTRNLCIVGQDCMAAGEFSNRIAVADFKPRLFALIFHILRQSSERGKMTNPVRAANRGMTF